MKELVVELEHYRYGEFPLKKSLAIVLHKIEMCDYMSALDALIKLREQIRNYEERSEVQC